MIKTKETAGNESLGLPHEEIYNFYEGSDPSKYSALTGYNLNRPVNELNDNVRHLAKELNKKFTEVDVGFTKKPDHIISEKPIVANPTNRLPQEHDRYKDQLITRKELEDRVTPIEDWNESKEQEVTQKEYTVKFTSSDLHLLISIPEVNLDLSEMPEGNFVVTLISKGIATNVAYGKYIFEIQSSDSRVLFLHKHGTQIVVRW